MKNVTEMNIEELTEKFVGNLYYAVSEHQTIVPFRITGVNIRNSISFTTKLCLETLKKEFAVGENKNSDWQTEDYFHEQYYATIYADTPDDKYNVFDNKEDAIRIVEMELENEIESIERKLKRIKEKQHYNQLLKG